MARQVVVVGKFVTRRRRMRESAVDFCPPSPMSTTTSVLLQGNDFGTHTHTNAHNKIWGTTYPNLSHRPG